MLLSFFSPHVRGQMNQLNDQERKLLKDVKDKEELASKSNSSGEDIETTNGVF